MGQDRALESGGMDRSRIRSAGSKMAVMAQVRLDIQGARIIMMQMNKLRIPHKCHITSVALAEGMVQMLET